MFYVVLMCVVWM